MTRMEVERRRRGWNQTTLAFHAGITQGEVSKIENRRLLPTDMYLDRLAQALDMGPSELLKEAAPAQYADAR